MIVPPNSCRFWRAHDFQEHQELLRIAVLRFVQNHSIIFLADSTRHIWLTHQLRRQIDLVGILNNAAFEAEIAVSALHFGRNAKRARVHPVAQRMESIAPAANKIFGRACAGRPWNELARFAPTLFPTLQFCLCLWNRTRGLTFSDSGVNFLEARVGTRRVRFRRTKIDLTFPGKLHQLAGLDTAILFTQGTADGRLLLHKLIPQIVIVRDQFQIRGQAEMMPMPSEQFYAEAVNRAKKSAVERFNDFQWKSGLKNLLPRALLHFIRRAVRVSNDDQPRQPLERVRAARYLNNAVSDGASFSRAGRCDHRKISIQFARETLARFLVRGVTHVRSPPFRWREPDGLSPTFPARDRDRLRAWPSGRRGQCQSHCAACPAFQIRRFPACGAVRARILSAPARRRDETAAPVRQPA